MNLCAQGIRAGRVLFRTLLRPANRWTWNNSSVDQITSGATKLTCEHNSRMEASQTTPNHHNFFLYNPPQLLSNQHRVHRHVGQGGHPTRQDLQSGTVKPGGCRAHHRCGDAAVKGHHRRTRWEHWGDCHWWHWGHLRLPEWDNIQGNIRPGHSYSTRLRSPPNQDPNSSSALLCKGLVCTPGWRASSEIFCVSFWRPPDCPSLPFLSISSGTLISLVSRAWRVSPSWPLGSVEKHLLEDQKIQKEEGPLLSKYWAVI